MNGESNLRKYLTIYELTFIKMVLFSLIYALIADLINETGSC